MRKRSIKEIVISQKVCRALSLYADRAGKFLSTMVTTKPKEVTAGTTVRDAIAFAGQQLRDGAWAQSKLDDFIDELFISKLISSIGPDSVKAQTERLQILEEGLLNASYRI